jgi:hypothetical protein
MSAQFPAVIVVRNEEALIRCLESVAWCEERIAIDMDTTDRTRELPKLGARLRAQVATGDGAAGVWLPRMSCWFGLRLPHIGDCPDYQLRCCREAPGSTRTGFRGPRSSAPAVSSGRRGRMDSPRARRPVVVALAGHGFRRLWSRRSTA